MKKIILVALLFIHVAPWSYGQTLEINEFFVDVMPDTQNEEDQIAMMQFKLNDPSEASIIQFTMSGNSDFTGSYTSELNIEEENGRYYVFTKDFKFFIEDNFLMFPAQIPENLKGNCRYFKIQVIDNSSKFSNTLYFNF